MIAQSLQNIHEQIRATCQKTGRNPAEVLFLAVSKGFPVDRVKLAIDAGHRDFGENYVQEFREKHKILSAEPVRWHFIGHLQSNKVKFLVGSTAMIHSVDSIRLAEEIQRQAMVRNCTVEVLVEVRTTDESTKTGVSPAEVVPLVRDIAGFDRVQVNGLMTIGPFVPNPEAARPCFRKLRELRDEIDALKLSNVTMRHLSMGMSGDFRIAIEEGSTIIRIGTAVFGTRPPRPGRE